MRNKTRTSLKPYNNFIIMATENVQMTAEERAEFEAFKAEKEKAQGGGAQGTAPAVCRHGR